MWDFVVDSFLERLNESIYYTIGYADDIIILLIGKFENVLCNLMQDFLRILEK